MDLAATDPRTNETKHFYRADFGRWTLERTRSSAYQPFALISLAGHSSRTDSVLFAYRFALRLEEAISDDGLVARMWPRRPVMMTFERDLKTL
jgi:hypothetical protein